jgi:hypothetical protein
MNSIIETVAAVQAWFGALSPQFAFLLALPFFVVVAGFAADALSRARRTAHAGSDLDEVRLDAI